MSITDLLILIAEILGGSFAATVLLYVGFFFYASAWARWDYLNIYDKIVAGTGIAIFGLFDVAFNITVGSLYYWDLDILHGRDWKKPLNWTFSTRSCVWWDQTKDKHRKHRADIIADNLNRVVPDHIGKLTD
jgi:hypothetical protein